MSISLVLNLNENYIFKTNVEILQEILEAEITGKEILRTPVIIKIQIEYLINLECHATKMNFYQCCNFVSLMMCE